MLITVLCDGRFRFRKQACAPVQFLSANRDIPSATALSCKDVPGRRSNTAETATGPRNVVGRRMIGLPIRSTADSGVWLSKVAAESFTLPAIPPLQVGRISFQASQPLRPDLPGSITSGSLY